MNRKGWLTGHEGVPEVVLAVLVIFDIFPLEVAAAAAVRWITVSDGRRRISVGCEDVPATFFSDTSYEIHDLWL